MKQVLKMNSWKMLVAFLVFQCMQVVVMAQEGSSTTTTTSTKSVDVNVETENWYAAPWVWIVGAALFILLLVALLSGGSRRSASSDRVTVTKTVERDTDV